MITALQILMMLEHKSPLLWHHFQCLSEMFFAISKQDNCSTLMYTLPLIAYINLPLGGGWCIISRSQINHHWQPSPPPKSNLLYYDPHISVIFEQELPLSVFIELQIMKLMSLAMLRCSACLVLLRGNSVNIWYIYSLVIQTEHLNFTGATRYINGNLIFNEFRINTVTGRFSTSKCCFVQV